ncbi:hypothetical protein [Flavobacterium selenitireducens]|uniref:hypothetical protein n=1 Tax=Flavobacterium selenitireducens TaxID=2722704 RepID=UPI00168ABF1B|nr:hypothetical protein [Flavobacterium selenitireducens]MBD3582454.1 hypothetical protein [Flavobacterium selenitireducens]
MKLRTLFTLAALVFTASVFAQSPSAGILATIVKHYYKNEKVVVKGRQQLLFLYCEKANNNEEIFEAVQNLKLPAQSVKQIRQQVNTDTQPANWQTELEAVYEGDETKIRQKINDCLSVEQYQERRAKLNLNNQRLMIVSKPVLFENGEKALVKVTFYRSIEHNNGSVLLMHKTASGWIIKEHLNSWST